MSLVAHDVGDTTYYACEECGACPCPEHDRGHTPDCSHRVPDEWRSEDCARMGPGRFMICSACQHPPCHDLKPPP
jgi:hypothetical protein